MGSKKKATAKMTVGCKPTKETGNKYLDDNKEKIEEAGGSGCITTAMRRHSTNSELQYTACAALAYFALLDDDKVKIEAVGGIECIATAMRRHPTNSQLHDMACATAGYNTEHVRL